LASSDGAMQLRLGAVLCLGVALVPAMDVMSAPPDTTGDVSSGEPVEPEEQLVPTPDTCAGKLHLMEKVGASFLLETPPDVGKKGAMTCTRGKCCSKMPNPTELRCNLALRDISNAKPRGRPRVSNYYTDDGAIGGTRQKRKLLFSSLPSYASYYYHGDESAAARSHGGKGRMWLCYWDEATETCKAKFRRFDPTAKHEACAQAADRAVAQTEDWRLDTFAGSQESYIANAN